MKCHTCDVKMQPKLLKDHEAFKCPICFSYMINIHHLRSLCSIDRGLFENLLKKIKSKTEEKAHQTVSYSNFSLNPKHHSMVSVSPPSGICPGCGTALNPLHFTSSKDSIETCFCCSCNTIQLQKKDLPGITGIFKKAKMIKPVPDPRKEAEPFQLKDLIPVLDEQSLFMISGTFFMLFGISENYRTFTSSILSNLNAAGGLFLFFLIAGMLLSLYHAFSKRTKLKFEKYILSTYTFILNLLISGAILGHMADHYEMPKLLLTVFPGINFFTAIIIIMAFNADSDLGIFERIVPEDNMPLRHLVFISFFLFMFLFSFEMLKIEWIISISIIMTFVLLKQSITAGIKALQQYLMSKPAP